MIGSLLDLGANIAGFQHAEEMQDDAQTYNYQRWQEQTAREDTAHRREVHDLRMAGLNPMLTMRHQGAPAGQGPSSPAPTHIPRAEIQAGMQSASQIQVNDAIVEKTKAEAAWLRAQTDDKLPAEVAELKQRVNESIERAKNWIEQARHATASAGQAEQQTRNLQEMIPQIRATVQQLQALTKLNEAQAIERLSAAGVNEAQAKEIWQRIKQNLPDIERRIMEIERAHLEMQTPGHMANEAAQSSLAGQIGAYLRALIPLQGIMGAIPVGRGARPPTPSGPIHQGTRGNPTIHRR